MISTTDFKSRQIAHDLIAMPVIDDIFSSAGYKVFETGIEKEKREFIESVAKRNDPLALKFRFHPDRMYYHDNKGVIVCEIKCEYQGHENFGIEFDSYLQAVKWSKEYEYIYAFVDIKLIDGIYKCVSKFCSGGNIPCPDRIYVPLRNDYKQFVTRIENEFPLSHIILRKHKTGSGTPYLLIPKNSAWLEPESRFFDDISISIPRLFDVHYQKKDISNLLFTHRSNGGLFLFWKKFLAWESNNGNNHLNPPPMITKLLTLIPGKMDNNEYWTFTSSQFDEFMRRVSLK